MSQIYDGLASGSFVEDGTNGGAIYMDLVTADVPIVKPIVEAKVVPELVPSQVASVLGQDQAPAMWPGSILWGAPLQVWVIPFKRFNFTTTRDLDTRMDNSIFERKVVSMGVRTWKPPFVAFNYSRTWNGIGGFAYIPSFPQLSRKETTWPHAT